MSKEIDEPIIIYYAGYGGGYPYKVNPIYAHDTILIYDDYLE